MPKTLLTLAATLLTGCGSPQERLDKAEPICRDGVEYLVYSRVNSAGHKNFSIVPHYKNGKGELFTCGGRPTPINGTN